ncbi:hypothetical protein PFLUV_G00091540 [Perca fluviatilis]|uniref:Thyroglobulin n=1 Tax=Perca fluviatilis TaxID=8168 RepID=A0A6A5F5G8_PERFL|nr:hypothetical protein PFLUV_G00091540 [Perca fluviatilis]
MARLLRIAYILVCCPALLQGKASEYQLESESQCELLRGVAVAKQQGASPCQLQSELRCSPSGLFESVQCESSRGQCWCVDQDGMELYGTRQTGTPHRCPGSCEVRWRRLLHGAESLSPPQCDEDGSFLPVQCKFINTTDRSELDLLSAFNRFPEAFETFSSFRKFFPMVSSFCFCADSRGRELKDTGPSPCEEERRAAMEASSVGVPSCETVGSFTPRQCQQGGQCWCVDPTGRELPGTRQYGDSLVCSSGLADCPSQRRLALSRLFSGPVDPSLRPSSGTSPASCLPLLRPLGDLLPAEVDQSSFLSRLVQVLGGLFPSVGGALQALARSSPQRLQENLFGGKFLKSAASFNFSGAVGARGALGLDRLSSQSVAVVLQKNRDLVRYVSAALEDPAFLSALQNTLSSRSQSSSLEQVLTPLLRSCSKDEDEDSSAIFVPSCTLSGGFQEVQCSGESAARAMALKVKGNLAAGAEIHIPACSEDGDFLPLQCVGSRCFCVDADGKTTTAGSTGGAVSCPKRTTQTFRSSAGRCSQALDEVTAFRQEVKSVIALSNSSHLPLGYGFLLAEGLRLTPEELQVSQSDEALRISDRLLSRSNAALRLAAFSSPSWCELQGSQCRPDGSFVPMQCDVTSCWCVSEVGLEVGGTRTLRQTGRAPSCDRPLCPDSAVTNGALVCRPAADGLQSCDLVCQRGYQNSLPVGSFLCETESGRWDGDIKPLSGACQISQPLQLVASSQLWELSASCSQISSLQSQLFTTMTSRGLCSGQCDGDDALTLTITWSSDLSDLPTSDLSDLHDIGVFLNESRLLEGVRGLLGNIRSMLTSEPKLVSVTTPIFGCSRGHRLASDGEGCVVCPAGSYSRQGACLLCPQGTYQDEEGRDFCDRCPRGSSPAGASSVNQCVTECQRRGLRCSERGDFLSAQPDFLSGRWRCVSSEGAELEWTNSDTPLTDEECSVLSRFQAVPGSDLIVGAEDTEVLQTMTSDLISCVQGVAFSSWRQQQQSFERMRMMKALSGVFRTQVFSSRRTSLSDAHRFCQDGCSRDACCDGFILNQNVLNGGSLLCGWLRAPSVLMCGDQDWDVIGQGAASRICGAGLTYNEQQRSFVFDFGGQKFTITDSSLPADSKNKKDYQASIISFQAIYLNSVSVQLKFESLSEDEVLVDPKRELPTLSFWLSKKNYNSQQALLWCLTRCDVEQLCSIADLRDGDSAVFFSCSLYSDSRVCGAYDKPLRRPCRPLLDRAPNNTYSKKVDLSGPVKSFYERVSFQKMVSYSVRSRVSLRENTPLSKGFMECERRCDEDPCCRGIGFVRDTKSPGGSDVVCLSLISLGVQTCGEDDTTTWRTQDCSPSAVKTTPDPFGWYQKPVNQWSSSPALCPPFSLPATTNNVSLDSWRLLSDSSVLVDPSVSTYDVIHVSRDIAADRDQTRDWCLHACQEAESCVAVSLGETASATRCVLYPDTTACGLSSAPSSSSPASSCRLIIKEPAPQVYLWTGDEDSAASSEDCLYLNIFTPAALRGRVPALVFFFNPSANQNPGLLDGSTLAAVGNIVVVTASYRTAALGFLSTGSSGLRGNYGLSDQEAVLRWVNAYISTVGGDNMRVTVGSERRGADISSLLLLSSSSSSSSSRLLFQRMMLMGGSVFSPSLLQTPSTSRRQALDLAKELGCVTSDLTDDDKMAACLRATPAHTLNAAQTKLLAVSGPFQSWSPVRQSGSEPSLHRVDLLLGTSAHDGLISRARRIKDFEALRGRADGKTAFYEALSRSLGGATGNELLKEAAAWFYSLDHSPSPAGYNLFSRALNNATRDLFIICPSLQMASHWANSKANVFLYHQPATSSYNRADMSVPLDVQFVFGTPHHPMSSQRFTSSDRRLSVAAMTYVSSFIRTGNPNPSRVWAESVLPRWKQVLSSEAPPIYLELSPSLRHRQGLSQGSCSFWSTLGTRLTRLSGESGAEPVQLALSPELPLAAPSSQSQTEKDAYS